MIEQQPNRKAAFLLKMKYFIPRESWVVKMIEEKKQFKEVIILMPYLRIACDSVPCEDQSESGSLL